MLVWDKLRKGTLSLSIVMYQEVFREYSAVTSSLVEAERVRLKCRAENWWYGGTPYYTDGRLRYKSHGRPIPIPIRAAQKLDVLFSRRA